VAVVVVEITPFACAFAHAAECQLAQAADLADHGRIG